MTFTIAEDIKRLLNDNYSNANVIILAKNGGFETGDLTDWTVTGTVISTTQKHAGTYSAKMTAISHALTQNIAYIPVDNLSAFEFWYYSATAGSGGAVGMTYTVTYSDATTTAGTVDLTVYDTWTKVDLLSSLTATKTIIKFKLVDVDSTELYIDDVTFTYNLASGPNFILIDDYPPTTYSKGGDVIIGREQLLRIDQYNGIRSETFLVDINLVVEDTTTESPILIKRTMSEMDRVLDKESIDHTTYYYKVRYDWLGSYRIGVTKFQVEVLNALVTRPGLI